MSNPARALPSVGQLARLPILRSLVDSWRLALDSANKSPLTIRSYTDTVFKLCAYLAAHDLPVDVEGVEANHVGAFLAAERDRTSAASAALHYRNLNVFFGWLATEGERKAPSPMISVERPTVPKKVKPPLSDDELKALLKTCSGSAFADRRDTAIIRTLMDTGMRVSSIAGLHYDSEDPASSDVDLRNRRLRIRTKGSDHLVPIGKKAAMALDRYLRARARHLHADSSWLWLGTKGKGVSFMTTSGIRTMLKRRAQEAGVANVNPHRLRRTFADQWLEGGGNVDDLMTIAGWKTFDMVKEYTTHRAAERARTAHARLSPGDRV